MQEGKTSYLKSTCTVGNKQSISYKSIVETFSGYKSVQNKSCKGQWRERDRETERQRDRETERQRDREYVDCRDSNIGYRE